MATATLADHNLRSLARHTEPEQVPDDTESGGQSSEQEEIQALQNQDRFSGGRVSQDSLPTPVSSHVCIMESSGYSALGGGRGTQC